ncbi:NAD(P)/FAD-dependent oxidoreductase [Rhodobium gokarnense]|uniref:Sarcosine oxidase subunit beta n=1 Tax=Rhodobium gokarnense TaxID=364296 RepID=A0ABT3H8C4_9HYPH|nr:FAD-dependent oxidoreductase [Rhodobium gokarnense]MCW2306643.1 sarcosine oxidase subunit beta [Rhodobium gokarnense]
MAETTDAIVIGAGIIGAATTLELARAGFRTLCVDSLPAAGYGPTSGSCAVIRVHYSTFEGTAFAYEGYHYWRDWADYLGVADERGLAEFRDIGCMVMCTDENGHLKKHTDICDEIGIPYQRWDAAKIEERLPFYDLRSYFPPKRLDDPDFGHSNGCRLKGSVFFPTAGYVTDPQLATHNLQRAAEAAGATFRFGRTVTEILTGAGRVSGVRLDDGTMTSAPIVVNVAGPASAKVNAMAGALDDMTISTRALKQEVVHVPAPDGVDFFNAAFPISDNDIGCYCRPEKGNYILIGSEDPACDPREWVDPDGYDTNFTDQWTHQAYRYAQRVPSLGIPSRMQGVVDLYDVSDDWIPIYDKSAVDGFFMAIGTSGNQFKNAPIAGKMMAALVAYCAEGHDHDTNPLQFELPYLGRSIDAGFYSRKRPINKESSFSVLG